MPIKTTRIRSPLKWPGGKYKLLDRIEALLPEGKRLIEPFVGSGVVFINHDYPHYLINDVNKDLIDFYKTVKQNQNDFIEYASTFFKAKNNNPTTYYRYREDYNATTDIRYRSALLLMINKFGYNGLMRYNADGKINVPFGRYTKPYFPEKELQALVERLKRAKITSGDFEKVMRQAKAGDVIYCDPPFVPLSQTANFTTYSAGGFSLDDQQRLATVAEEVSQEGVTVVISNHDTPLTRKLYKRAKLTSFSVRRTISCDGSNRALVTELLAIYPKPRKS